MGLGAHTEASGHGLGQGVESLDHSTRSVTTAQLLFTVIISILTTTSELLLLQSLTYTWSFSFQPFWLE